jgi:DTW domain-containing protein
VRSRVPDLSRRCPACLFPPAACLCPEIPRLRARTRVVFLRHAMERRRTTNTGRWAALALGAEIVDHALPDRSLPPVRVPTEGAAVLFPAPGGDAPPHPLPTTLVVVDASWSQARRMVQRIPSLQRMPRLSLPAEVAVRLRRPTVPGGMSTLEATAAALEILGDLSAARGLRELHRLAVARALALRCAAGEAA